MRGLASWVRPCSLSGRIATTCISWQVVVEVDGCDRHYAIIRRKVALLTKTGQNRKKMDSPPMYFSSP
jgi:hypothetical protein